MTWQRLKLWIKAIGDGETCAMGHHADDINGILCTRYANHPFPNLHHGWLIGWFYKKPGQEVEF